MLLLFLHGLRRFAAARIRLIALALAIDSPTTEYSLPEAKSFLVFLGAVVGAAGIIMGLSRE
jgi:hypothetical protein